MFGYGSLMWNPGFAFQEDQAALLRGYHRAFCVLSHQWRGTPERPGLVLGLDLGGSCRGRAFLVPPAQVPGTMAALVTREMPTRVYTPRFLPVTLADGRRVTAWTFVARRDHPQYLADRRPETIAALIRQGVGKAGPARDYLANTVEQLEHMGLPDRALIRLLALVDG